MTISRRTRTAWAAIVLAAAGWTSAGTDVTAEVLDRILAVVGRELITLSDTYAVLRLGLVPPQAAGDDPVRAALDTLIARQLELAEVNRYVPPEPQASAIDARLAAIRGRFAEQAAFDAVLTRSGLTLEQVRLRIRDDLRIESYLDQRFGGAMVQPRDEELIAYYRANEAAFTQGGVLRPFADVRTAIRERLAGERRDVVVREWVEGLRRRSEVSDLYLTPKTP